MKTLLNKKFTFALAALVLFTSIAKAQVPDKLKNLPPFNLLASKFKSLHKPHSPRKLNERHCSSNAFCLKAQSSLGGSGYDQGDDIIPTRDGGFIVCGITFSNDGDFHTKDTTNGDAFIAKYNKFRKLEWIKTYGGTGNDELKGIVQTYDGGYMTVGATNSNDGDVSGNHGGLDVWLVKLNPSGNIEWQKCFGGTGDESGNAIVQTFYGGYAIACGTNSNDGDVSGNHNTDGNFDGWFIQVSPKGYLSYQHCYGGSDYDVLFSIVQPDFGSYVLEGYTQSNDGDVSGNYGGGDVWAVKINILGKIVWQRPVGGSDYDATFSNEITRTTDGNVVISGLSYSTDGDINAPQDTIVSFSTKLSLRTGNIIWSKSYAKPSFRLGFGIFATRDGGTVETCDVTSSYEDSDYDVLISKFDKNGNEEWYKQLGGSDFDGSVTGYEYPNGDLNILCQTASTDGDVKNNHGNVDTWIIKLGPCGNYIAGDATSSDNATSSTKNNTANLSVYPNPVFNTATIAFNLQQSQKVSLTIYDMNGRLIKTLANAQMQSGNYQLIWNTKDENVVAGIYLLKLQAGNYTETKKISVVK